MPPLFVVMVRVALSLFSFEGVTKTFSMHAAPGARVSGSVPQLPTSLKSPALVFVPAVTAIAEIVSPADPPLVMETGCAWLVVLMGRPANVSVEGETSESGCWNRTCTTFAILSAIARSILPSSPVDKSISLEA